MSPASFGDLGKLLILLKTLSLGRGTFTILYFVPVHLDLGFFTPPSCLPFSYFWFSSSLVLNSFYTPPSCFPFSYFWFRPSSVLNFFYTPPIFLPFLFFIFLFFFWLFFFLPAVFCLYSSKFSNCFLACFQFYSSAVNLLISMFSPHFDDLI